jgi:hypothetical protein
LLRAAGSKQPAIAFENEAGPGKVPGPASISEERIRKEKRFESGHRFSDAAESLVNDERLYSLRPDTNLLGCMIGSRPL